MIHVAVCDDDAKERAQLVAAYRTVSTDAAYESELLEFARPEEFLAADPSRFDLAFLDIEMPGCAMDGMELAKLIRDRHKGCTVVLVTNYLEYAPQGYSAGAYRYIMKPVREGQLALEIGKLLPEIERRHQAAFICLKSAAGVAVLRRREISYIETGASKSVVFHTTARAIANRSSLSHWEDELAEDGFFRIHSAFLVNLAFVHSVGKAEVLLTTGEALPVSKHRRRDLLAAFTAYMGAQL